MNRKVHFKHLVLSSLLSVSLLGAYATNVEAAETTSVTDESSVETVVITTETSSETNTVEATNTKVVAPVAEASVTSQATSESVASETILEQVINTETPVAEAVVTEAATAETEPLVVEDAVVAESTAEAASADATVEIDQDTAVLTDENLEVDMATESAADDNVVFEDEYVDSDNEELVVDQNSASYDAGAEFDEGGTEIVTYNPTTDLLCSVNGAESALDIIRQDADDLVLVDRIYLEDYDIVASDLTSVAVHSSGDYIAVAAPAAVKTDDGQVVFFDNAGNVLNVLHVGALPDMVTFTSDGKYALVANEGEPNDDYDVNPAGSLSVITLSDDITALTQDAVNTVFVTAEDLPEDLRTLGITSEDFVVNVEPEYIAVDANSEYAYVSFQEVSAIGKFDIANAQFLAITSMGYKDHSIEGNGLDASDKDDAIHITTAPVLGMYQPDAIDVFEANGETYIITANEGDTQDYDGFSEEVRVADLADAGLIQLDAKYYECYTQAELDALVENGLFDKDQLGRLTVTVSHPFMTGDVHNALVTFGGRSFSIIRASDMQMIFDSGDDFEQITAAMIPDWFNADVEGTTLDDVSMDGRSDNKGPETESVVVGTVGDQQYAFIASERTGGFFIYNVTDAENPYFIDYLYDPSLTNISLEGLYFVSAEDSDTGRPMLVVAHELSGTITTFDITSLLEDTDGEIPVEEEPVVEVPTDVDGNEVPNSANGGQVVTTPRVTEGPYGNIVEVEEYDHVGINLAAAAEAEKDANNSLNVDVAGASLPETGSENTSIFGLIGLAIAGLGSFLVRPFKKEN